jgi:hypothetical protein
MPASRILIFLIVSAIVMQNTCPYGWAAKTAFASPQASHCPMKEHHRPSEPDNGGGVKKDFSNTSQVFVIHCSKPASAVGFFSPAARNIIAEMDKFRVVSPEPPLRPPAFSLPS